MNNQYIFERTEKKYVISAEQANCLINNTGNKITEDKYGKSTIRSLYFDTEDFRLIRQSIEKPVYKEKLRLRSYFAPKSEDTVFLELKKKYKGVVFKRREKIKYGEAVEYIHNHKMPKDTQIMREIDFVIRFYPNLLPRMLILYDRLAYNGSEDKDLRITFDFNLRYRTDNLSLDKNGSELPIISDKLCIMEIKALNSIPLWLSRLLSKMDIYPSSFSKYGSAYRLELLKTANKNYNNGGINCA